MKIRGFCLWIYLLFAGPGTLSADSIWTMSPQEVRQMINAKIMATEAETPEVHEIKNLHTVRSGRATPLRIYIPDGGKHLPIVLLIHGGGWVAGNLDTHDNLARYLCRNAKVLVVSVGYGNSPESKFPLPLEQCYDALLWIASHAKDFSADVSKIAVAGDSAGGNMAAALCLLDRDRLGPKIDLQVLINPSPDLTGRGTLEPQGDAYDMMRWFALQYVANPEDVYNPYASPCLAMDLKGLPPALVVLADKDALFEDGERYAKKLSDAGVPTTVYIQQGIGHLAGDGARASKAALESLNVVVEKLRQVFQN